MIVGSPGVVDTDTWNRGNPDADKFYNDNLTKLANIAKDLAAKNGFPYSDVNGNMHVSMNASKAKYGPNYHLGGGDGVHPWANGHLVMAYSFLKAMNFNGKIAQVTKALLNSTAVSIRSVLKTTVTTPIQTTLLASCRM